MPLLEGSRCLSKTRPLHPSIVRAGGGPEADQLLSLRAQHGTLFSRLGALDQPQDHGRLGATAESAEMDQAGHANKNQQAAAAQFA